MKRKFKLSFSLLLILFLISTLSLFASNAYTFSQGEEKTTGLYNSSGKKLDLLNTEISSDGYIIVTGGVGATFSSNDGEIYIAEETIVTLSGFTTNNPVVNLLQGKINIISLTGFSTPLEIETATSIIKVTEPGEYSFIYTEEDDKFYNFSSFDAKVEDILRNKTVTIGTYKYGDFLLNTFDNEVTENDYTAIAIDPWDEYIAAEEQAKKPIVEEVIAAEPIVEETKEETYSVSFVVSSVVKPIAPTLFVTSRFPTSPGVPELHVVKREVVVNRIPEAPVLSVVTTTELGLPEFKNITREIENTTVITSTRTIENTTTITSTRTPEEEVIVIAEPVFTEETPIIEEEAPIEEEILTEDAPQATLRTEQFAQKRTFDVYFQAEKGPEATDELIVSVLPEYTTNVFTARLKLNLNQIEDAKNLNQSTKALDYVKFATSFIDEISYKALNEKFSLSLSRDNAMVADKAGLALAADEFNFDRQTLSFSHMLNIGNYKHILYFSDLGFTSTTQFAYADLSYKLSSSFPLTIGLAGLAELDFTTLNNSILYPEVYVAFQVYKNGLNYTDIKLAGTTPVVFDGSSEFFNSWMANVAVEGNIAPVNFGAGLALSHNNLFYGYDLVNNLPNYTAVTNVDKLSIFADAGLDFGFANFELSTILPFDTNQMKFIKGEDFYKATISANYDDLTLTAGYRVFGLMNSTSAFKDNSQIAVSLGYGNEVFKLKATAVLNGPTLKPQIEFISRVSFKNSLFSNKEYEKKALANFYVALETDINATLDNTLITLVPKVGYKTDNFSAILRVPVGYNKDGFTFSSYYDNNIFTYGSNQTTGMAKALDIIADAASLIEEVKAGKRFSLAQLNLSREGYNNNTFVSPLMLTDKDDALSLNFRFYADTLEGTLFIDDLAMPTFATFNFEYSALSNTVLPFLNVGVTLEDILYEDESYDLTIVPELKAGLRTRNNSSLTLFANVQLDLLSHTNVPLTFSNFAAGLSIDARLSAFRLLLAGGVQNGTGRSTYLDAFAIRNRTLTSPYSLLEMGYFASANALFSVSVFDFKVGYELNDLMNFATDTYKNDTFNVSFSLKTDKNTPVITFGLARRCIKDTFANISTFNLKSFLLDENTILSAKIEKEFDNVSFVAALSNAPKYEKVTGTLNYYKPIVDSNNLTLSFKATYRF